MPTESPDDASSGDPRREDDRDEAAGGIAARMVRAVRRRRRISQRELAALAKVTRSTVDRIETGAVQPRVDTLINLLTAAGYPLVLVDNLGTGLIWEDAT